MHEAAAHGRDRRESRRVLRVGGDAPGADATLGETGQVDAPPIEAERCDVLVDEAHDLTGNLVVEELRLYRLLR